MYLHDLIQTENNPVYQKLAAENLARQYDFLRSIVEASIHAGQPLLSISVLKALNYHAICCLHSNAGEFRPCEVQVGVYQPPLAYRVPGLMQMFTNEVNRVWEATDPVSLATFVLWRLNWIHPFINGNGRTARTAAYLVLCLKLGGSLAGDPILPELLRANRAEYVLALQAADAGFAAGNTDFLAVLHALVARLLNEQLMAAAAAAPGPSPAPAAPIALPPGP